MNRSSASPVLASQIGDSLEQSADDDERLVERSLNLSVLSRTDKAMATLSAASRKTEGLDFQNVRCRQAFRYIRGRRDNNLMAMRSRQPESLT
jgi:hypothetical protein